MVREFRQKVIAETGIIPFEHQAAWMALTDGQVLVPETERLPKMTVRLPDGELAVRSLMERWEGRARFVAELGAYKCGKSFGAALWATGFAAIPEGRVYLVGIEYDMCVPEFDNLLEFLISSRGLGLPYKVLQNRPKDGRLWLELENGCRFEARSWERSESLKGKEVDAYIFCEAYQLPGIECFMSIKQNLRARDGYAIFPTTPDNPWVATLHENGHDPAQPEWACQCGVPASVNPFTYSSKVQDSDERLMTREKFSIAYLGKIGTYIGRVFAYQRGEKEFNTKTHPYLWYDPAKGATPENLRIPPNWNVLIGADTGTYMAAVVVAFDENGDAFVLDELTNYRYVGGTQIELEPDIGMATWAERFKKMAALWTARPFAWVDTNSQFKQEFWNQYHIQLIGNPAGRQARTEAAREFFHNDRIRLAPWLSLLPCELEHCQWPPEATVGGKFERLKLNDHLVDGVEHLCSRHPLGKKIPPLAANPGYPTHHEKARPRLYGDIHMGRG